MIRDTVDYLGSLRLSGDGHISSKELGKVMKKLGRRMSQAALLTMINEFDADKSGLRMLQRRAAAPFRSFPSSSGSWTT